MPDIKVTDIKVGDWIGELAERLRTQNNEMTAHPIFVVEHRSDARRPWEFVTACLTDVGARDYMQANGHNLRKHRRIFIHSGFRNAEWIALRDYLLRSPAPEPCVWVNLDSMSASTYAASRTHGRVDIVDGWSRCPYCGAPLQIAEAPSPAVIDTMVDALAASEDIDK